MVIKPSKSAAENKDDLARRIGFKLKELRKSMGMTMKRLVEETEPSAPPHLRDRSVWRDSLKIFPR